jgi:hypothetical protein
MSNKYFWPIAIIFSVVFVVGLCVLMPYKVEAASGDDSDFIAPADSASVVPERPKEVRVEVVDYKRLRAYFPKYSSIDLVCGKMPSKADERVIMMAEAAFTGELLKDFKHFNVGGDHVSNGKRYHGFACSKNSGAFVYYQDHAEFFYKDYSNALDTAAARGGMGFCQMMMIHHGEEVPYAWKSKSFNEFRALCLLEDRVAVVDSKGGIRFGEFVEELLKAGVVEALYLDMGTGWNYSWYRNEYGDAVEIHEKWTPYATNWITFYK